VSYSIIFSPIVNVEKGNGRPNGQSRLMEAAWSAADMRLPVSAAKVCLSSGSPAARIYPVQLMHTKALVQDLLQQGSRLAGVISYE